MPADYKYEFISKGRMMALQRACVEVSALHRQLKASGIIASSLLERFDLLRTLLAPAACHPLSTEQIQILEQLFGPDLDKEPKD